MGKALNLRIFCQVGIGRSVSGCEFGLEEAMRDYAAQFPDVGIDINNKEFPLIRVLSGSRDDGSRREQRIKLPVLTSDGRVISTITGWLIEQVAAAKRPPRRG